MASWEDDVILFKQIKSIHARLDALERRLVDLGRRQADQWYGATRRLGALDRIHEGILYLHAHNRPIGDRRSGKDRRR